MKKWVNLMKLGKCIGQKSDFINIFVDSIDVWKLKRIKLIFEKVVYGKMSTGCFDSKGRAKIS